MDGGLGDAVHVDQLRLPIAVTIEPRAEHGKFEDFTAEDDIAQAQSGAARFIDGDQLAEGGRSLVEDGNLPDFQQLMKLPGERLTSNGTTTRRPP